MKLQTLKSRVRMLSAPTRVAAEVNPSSWRTSDQNSTQRGYGYKWQQARAGFLLKHPHCVLCLEAMGVTAAEPAAQALACYNKGQLPPIATVVDHKVAHRGDMKVFWDKSKWQSLCKTCHDSHAQRRDRAAG